MQQITIHLKGRLDERWSSWLEGFTICYSDQDETILNGTVVDQAAMYGLIGKLRDLGAHLISVDIQTNRN